MEMLSGVFWGTGLLERWVANRGYSPVKYLPFLFQQSSSYRAEFPPYDKTYVLGDGDPSEGKYLQDYRQTMTEGYLDYLGAFEDWMQTLGMNHSAEVSYHMPVDMVCMLKLQYPSWLRLTPCSLAGSLPPSLQ